MDDFASIRVPGVKGTAAIVAKREKNAPERGAPLPARPDRGCGHPTRDTGHPGRGRPDRAFEDGLPGEPIVPDRDDAESTGEVIVPEREP